MRAASCSEATAKQQHNTTNNLPLVVPLRSSHRSVVDLKVLALAYELERESCGSVDHLRKEPKKQGKKKRKQKNRKKRKKRGKKGGGGEGNNDASNEAAEPNDASNDADLPDDDDASSASSASSVSSASSPSAPPASKSWAMLVNSTAAPLPTEPNQPPSKVLSAPLPATGLPPPGDSQFDDASETSSVNYSDDDTYAGSECDISDEECDIYVLDEDELSRRLNGGDVIEVLEQAGEGNDVEEELTSDFPSLNAAASVPYEGSDDEDDKIKAAHAAGDNEQEEEDEEAKKKVR